MQENISSKNIAYLDKLSKHRYFFLLLSFALYLDTTLIIFYDTNILEIDYLTIKEHIKPGEFLLALVGFSFFLSILTPFLSHVFALIFSYISSKYDFFDTEEKLGRSYKFDTDVLYHGVNTNNSCEVNLYYKHVENIEEARAMSDYALSVIIIYVANYYFSSEKNKSISIIFEDVVNGATWSFVSIISSLSFFILAILLFFYIEITAKEHHYMIYYPEVEKEKSN